MVPRAEVRELKNGRVSRSCATSRKLDRRRGLLSGGRRWGLGEVRQPGRAPIGVELTAPSAVSLEDISELLARLGQTRLGSDEWAPLAVA